MLARNFDAILFDAGGIFLVPDPTVIGPLLAYHGGDPSISVHLRAHYAGMAAKSVCSAAFVAGRPWQRLMPRTCCRPARRSRRSASRWTTGSTP